MISLFYRAGGIELLIFLCESLIEFRIRESRKENEIFWGSKNLKLVNLRREMDFAVP